MEFLAGEDLQELLKRTGALPPEVALRIAAQACLGLSKAHAAHVMHRDIKPANLFLARRGDGAVVVKILDFGVAKIRPEGEHGQETTGLTRTGGMIGSPMYMSPSRRAGSRPSIPHRPVVARGGHVPRPHGAHAPRGHRGARRPDRVALLAGPGADPGHRAVGAAEIAAVAHGALQIAPEARFTDAQAMLDAMRLLLPNGDALTVSALVPLDAERRAVIAARLSETTADPSAPGVVGRTPAPSTSDDLAPPAERPAPVTTTQANASTGAPVVPTRPPPPPHAPSRWTAAVVAGAIGVVGVGAFGVLRATSSMGTAPDAAAPDASAPATAEPPTPAASATPRVAPVAEAARRVMLVVMPAGVFVDVDGAPAKIQDGTVEIEGPLGSVHHVRVHRGKAEVAADVIVTDSGAVPPKLELDRGAPGAGKGPAGPAPGSSTAPKPRGTGNPLMPDRFE